ncbi:MAG TPA: YdeI/OmpD-associated family protein, partial [Dehalococcoidia bacterium]|nr:YdeI/OmpD-associated family protein [Dehalococcoidia bacterium]
MVELGETLYVIDAASWRAWLEANHDNKREIWLVYHTKASGVPSIPYNDAVDEALCFGWIDSTVKKHGPESRAQRFTPRRPGSALSEMNKARLRRMVEQGRVTQAGLIAAGDVLNEPYEVPPDILAALQANETTWRNFAAFPDSYKRIRVGWIDGSRKRQDVFETRLAYFLKMTKQNKRFGMVQ